MAATKGLLTKHQQEQVRAAIKTTQLVKRLQHFALDDEDEWGGRVDIDPLRLRAIEVLLKKSLPDLASMQITGDEENPVHVQAKVVREIIYPAGKPE